MSTDYTYDEQGQFFPYFILTITSIITLPLTYSFLRPSKELENTAPRIHSDFKPEHADLIDGQKAKQKRRERKLKRMVASSVGWAMMTFMIYLIIVTARTVPQIWDPYDVLGVSRSATEKQIKSHYRKLSLTQHPDKVKLDAAANVTIESVNEHWVEITKAFKALTDEEIRNNFLQYGHPDGKQSFSIGIALPQFLVAEGSGKYVLLFYVAILAVFLPWLVGRWWYGSQKTTKDGVLVNSAGAIFQGYEDDLKPGGVLEVLCGGQELEEILTGNKAHEGLSTVESRVVAPGELGAFAGGLSAREKDALLKLDEGAKRKALALLWAYLGRLELGDQTLNDEKFEVPPIAFQLNEAFVVIALAFANIEPLISSYHLSQCLVQAVAPGASPLLQLPYFTPKIVEAVEGSGARTHWTIQRFMALPADVRKSKVVGPGLLTGQQYQEANALALRLPLLRIEKAFFKVNGERYVTPNSLTQFVIKARVIPPGWTDIPDIEEKDLEDPDEPEKSGEDVKRIAPPLAYAPYYARDHSPRWHVFLGDGRQGKVAVPPFTFSTFDKPLFKEDGTPTYAVQTLKMQFGAPPQPGQYTFAMHMVCDSYIGFDAKANVTLVIEDAGKAEDIGEEGEISEPDEDTLAGQMRALRSGAKEESDDESTTEGDEGSDTSETDTDTDED
ncbi:protein translocation protein SEC63 [Trichodelitschia bisporula]|uniref:Protein translocation protein SEC63 n=1 Tax=Trichodelitschia bisporula TaxID=703511 RepID=A0A6G1HJH8_9PEZI|nr:protein translocation protein SEC63 [Trichodelitschia bisporula]